MAPRVGLCRGILSTLDAYELLKTRAIRTRQRYGLFGSLKGLLSFTLLVVKGVLPLFLECVKVHHESHFNLSALYFHGHNVDIFFRFSLQSGLWNLVPQQ